VILMNTKEIIALCVIAPPLYRCLFFWCLKQPQIAKEKLLLAKTENSSRQAAWERLHDVASALWTWSRTQTRKVFPVAQASAVLESSFSLSRAEALECVDVLVEAAPAWCTLSDLPERGRHFCFVPGTLAEEGRAMVEAAQRRRGA
jgi:hypothetical protein